MSLKKFLHPAGSSISRFAILSVIAILACTLVVRAVRAGEEKVTILLPGTQPMIVGLDQASTCRQCHGSPLRPDVRIYPDWSGTMMAHSARDPIFYAEMAIDNKYLPSVGPGEFCLRCHAPAGWLAGHSEDFTGRSIVGADLDGITCDYCHRTVDPLHPDSLVSPLSTPVPGYGNGMHVIQKSYEPKRGPFEYPYVFPDSTKFSPPHRAMMEEFLTTGDFCGICHDISNPFHVTENQKNSLPPFAYAPLERTYSEWFASSFSSMGEEGSCQSCHMKDTPGNACSYASAPFREAMGKHDLTGGNTFVPDILPDLWPDLDSTKRAELPIAKARAVLTLRSAAELSASAVRLGDTVNVSVRVTNLTGHKLPTGYPFGRRVWINLTATDIHGDTVFTSGRYDTSTALLQNDAQQKVYQAVHGMTDTTARKFGLNPGPSFHFALNDTILFDNRIPPQGFTNEGFLDRQAEPVGVTYADSQYWDDSRYTLPKSAAHLSIRLMYQTITKEYVDFLRDENIGNSYDWGRFGARLDSTWNLHGKSTPVVMNEISVDVHDSVTTGIGASSGPLRYALAQNYPNPFNPATTIRYSIASAQRVTLAVYNTLGAHIALLVDKFQSAGEYQARFDGTALPSGIYFVRINAGSFTSTRKLLLIK